jgi:hypothetical protein
MKKDERAERGGKGKRAARGGKERDSTKRTRRQWQRGKE